jgi:NADPH:quinone reductase-like Zn-dependent oxidoreductase
MVGTIAATKSSVWKEGTRVASIFNQDHLTGQVRESDLATGLGLPLPGVLAEYRVFPEHGLVQVPEYLSDEEGACLPIAAVTAWMSINGFQPLGKYLDYSSTSTTVSEEERRKNEPPSILVQGTGGVAMAGLQIAHAAGFKTIVTSSSDSKLDRAKKLGAGTLINYRTHWEWQGLALEATGGKGVTFILETGGARTLRKSFDSIAFGGTIACIGYVSGKGNEGGDGNADGSAGESELNRLNVNVLALRRNVTLKGILNGPKDRFEEMLGFYEEKKIKPVVDKVFSFGEAKEAFQFLYKGEHFGKVVIKI